MTTLSDVIEQTMRRLLPAQLDLTAQLSTNITDTQTQFALSLSSSPVTPAVTYGEVLSVDLELMYVTEWDLSSKTVIVQRGYQGSTPAAHSAGALVYLQPKFTRFDCMAAINEELNSLSGAGLYQVKTDDITYNPVFMGYDLPMDPGFIEVLGVRYQIAVPSHNYPPVKRWAVLPNMTGAPSSYFPSGQALVIYEPGWPGLPLHVWYSSAFDPLVNLTDNVVTVSGLPTTAVDILTVGAQIIMVNSREVKRNFLEAQPDPRKAPEVPAQAVANSIKGLEAWRANRIAEERTRLYNRYKNLKVKA